jgi:2-dehydrotetronate isomerase
MPRFAANLSMLYNEHAFMDRFEAAARDGFKAVEYLFPYSFSAQDIALKLKTHHLSQVLFNAPPGGTDPASIEKAWNDGMRGTACIPGKEEEFRTGVLLALEYAKALQCPRVHIMAGLLPDDMSREQAVGTYVANLKWACAQAAPAGVDLLIEPINTRDIPRFFLNRQDHAHEVLALVGASNLKVQMDLYHCQIVEGDLAMKLKKYVPSGNVGHLQIAGVPQRHEPNIGEINYPYLFQLIDELGFKGWIGCEYRPQQGTSAGLAWLSALQEKTS